MTDRRKPTGMGGPRSMDLLADLERTSAATSIMQGALPQGHMAIEIVTNISVTLAKRMGVLPPQWSDAKCELALHKYRYEMAMVDQVKREQSREWLEKRGFHRLNNAAWPPHGLMPEDVADRSR